LNERLDRVSPDRLPELLTTFVNALLSAQADAGRRPAQAASGLAASGLAVGAPQAGRAGADVGDGDLLPARYLHPAEGQASADPGDHRSEQVAELGDGQELDERIEQFRTRQLEEAGPFTFVAAEASCSRFAGRPGGPGVGAGRHRRQRRRPPRDSWSPDDHG
jgi:hypothetical protein